MHPPSRYTPVEQFDTKDRPDLAHLPKDSYEENLVLAGYFRGDQSLAANGGITLDGGVLYVNGDLTLKGRFAGVGGVFVKGSVGITAPAQWGKSSKTLVSNGPIVIRRQ